MGSQILHLPYTVFADILKNIGLFLKKPLMGHFRLLKFECFFQWYFYWRL